MPMKQNNSSIFLDYIFCPIGITSAFKCIKTDKLLLIYNLSERLLHVLNLQ